MRCASWARWFAGLLACCFTVWGSAQAPLPQPDLDLWAGGTVYAMAATPDGGRIVGGDFAAVGGLPRRNLARLRADGTVDPTWTADTNGPVRALAMDASGLIYVAGGYTQLAGQSRNALGRLTPAGQLDPGWNPAPMGGFGADIKSLLVADGRVYVGGEFSQIGGQLRAGLARFDLPGGQLDLGWNPPAWWGGVVQLAADSTHLYVATAATNGVPLIRYPLSGNAVIDPGWVPQINGPLTAVAIAAPGAIVVAGEFALVQGASRSRLARLSTAVGASVDPQWQPDIDGWVGSLEVAGGSVYAGGRFHLGGEPSWRHLAKYSSSGTGALDPGFAPIVRGGTPLTLLVAGGNLHVGGSFTSVSGELRPALATVSSFTGEPMLPATVAESRSAQVNALLRLADGSLLVGGRFTRIGAFPRLNLARLAPGGNLDDGWRLDLDGQPVPYVAAPGNATFDFPPAVHTLEKDATGQIYVGGAFDLVGGQSRTNLARFNGIGQVDSGWNPAPNGIVRDLQVDNLGFVHVAGNFSSIGSVARISLARLSAAAGAAVDPQWQANLNLGATAEQLLLDGLGSLFVAGNGFDAVNGVQCCEGVIKLAAGGSGALDPVWNVRLTGSGRRARAIALDAGYLYIAGRFDGVFQGGSGHSRNALARVDAQGSGTLDPIWNPADTAGFGNEISALAVDATRVYVSPQYQLNRLVSAYSISGTGPAEAGWSVDGESHVSTLLLVGTRLYAGGSFTSVNGHARQSLAAFATDSLYADGFE